jgi:hypothetical protein
MSCRLLVKHCIPCDFQYCSLATDFSSSFLSLIVSLIADILVLVGAVQVYTLDTAPLLGHVSNFDHEFIFALRLVTNA